MYIWTEEARAELSINALFLARFHPLTHAIPQGVVMIRSPDLITRSYNPLTHTNQLVSGFDDEPISRTGITASYVMVLTEILRSCSERSRKYEIGNLA
jgi:hypothetical protein